MTVSVLGCGWFGFALAKALIEDGVQVKGSVTKTEKLELLSASHIEPYLVQFNGNDNHYDPEFFKCDILFISIPPRARQGDGEAYSAKIRQIIKVSTAHNVKKIVYISSTGIYGDQNCLVNELTEVKPDTESGRILQEAENLFIEQEDIKTTIIRFAGLVGPGRDPGRFFAGKKDIPNGQAPVNLIHLDDCIGISRAIIENDLFGQIINAASPHHPPKSEFYRQASLTSGLALPVFIDELLEWKIVDSVILTQVLHYQFKVQKWY